MCFATQASFFHAGDSIDTTRLDGQPLAKADRLWVFMYALWNALNSQDRSEPQSSK